jgi:hypothetical protein
MGVIWPWERKKVQRELDSVEHMLESMFKPVQAHPSFTSDLRKRLVGKPGPLAKAGLTTLELILLIGGAILGTIVFVFTIGRSIIGLVGRIRPRGGRRQPPKPAAGPKHAAEPKKRAA